MARTFRTRVAALAVTTALAVGFSTTAPAQAIGGELYPGSVTNIGYKAMKVCRDAASYDKCAKASPTRWLYHNQNSKTWYRDTDMIWIDPGYYLVGYQNIGGVGGKYGRWFKIGGGAQKHSLRIWPK